MSILSVAWHRLFDKHDDPAAVWADTKAQSIQWGQGIIAKLPSAAQPMVEALVSDVKQGASDLVGQAGDALPQLLQQATPVLDDAFAKVATAYLGPAVGGALSAAEVDGLNRIESAFIAWIKSAKLTHLAAATGASAPPPQPTGQP